MEYANHLKEYAPAWSASQVDEEVARIRKAAEARNHNTEVYKFCYSAIDLTTLSCNDSVKSVTEFARKAAEFYQKYPHIPNVASICIYPSFVETVGLAVDGSASNDCSNLLAEIRAAYLLHRLTYSAKAPTGYDLLKMATMGSARLLGRQDEIGSLEVGKAADLFLLDVDLLELAGAKLDPACMLGTVGYARPAELVMVNGRVVVEHGRVLGMDEEQTRVRAQQLVDGMLQKAE